MRTSSLKATLERRTGESIESLRDMPLADRRAMVEKKMGHKMEFRSHFPVIGRGNVLHHRTMTSGEVEKAVTRALNVDMSLGDSPIKYFISAFKRFIVHK